jgi:tRNA pseudouridine65 synthase
MFVAHQAAKEYVVVVRGYIAEQGVIDHPLRTDDAPFGIQARTLFRRIATTELPFAVGRYASARYSLAAVQPRTGRTHQIRRHMKHLAHPVIGDTIHGQGSHNRFFREQFGVGRLLLHAQRLTIPHPATGEQLSITAPIPEQLLALYAALGWHKIPPGPHFTGAEDAPQAAAETDIAPVGIAPTGSAPPGIAPTGVTRAGDQ